MKKNFIRTFLIFLCILLIPFPAFAVNEDYIPVHIDGYYDDWTDKAPTEVYPGKNPPEDKINYVKLFRDDSKVYVYVEFAYKNNQDITNMIINLYTNMGDEDYFLVPDHWFDTTDTTLQDMAPEADSGADTISPDIITEESGGTEPADQSLSTQPGNGAETAEPDSGVETAQPEAPAGQSGTESVDQNANPPEQNADASQQESSPNRGSIRAEQPRVYANPGQETYMLVADNNDNQGNNDGAADSAVTIDSTGNTNNGQGNGSGSTDTVTTTDTTEKTNNGQGNGPDNTDKTNNGQGNGPVDLTNPADSLDDVLDLLDPMNPDTLTDPEDMLDEIISDTPTDSGIETGADSEPAMTTDSGVGTTTDSGMGTTTDTGIGSDINPIPDSTVDQEPQTGNLDLNKPGHYGTWSFTVWSGLHPVGSGFYTRTEGAPDELELDIPLSSISHHYDGITEITMLIKKLGPQMIMCAGASTEPYIGVMIGAGIAMLSVGAYSYKKKRLLPFSRAGKQN